MSFKKKQTTKLTIKEKHEKETTKIKVELI